MVKGDYRKPVLRTFNCPDLLEVIGPGHAGSGPVNIDVYRGAMLKKTYEYRIVKVVDIDNKIWKIQEVEHA